MFPYILHHTNFLYSTPALPCTKRSSDWLKVTWLVSGSVRIWSRAVWPQGLSTQQANLPLHKHLWSTS